MLASRLVSRHLRSISLAVVVGLGLCSPLLSAEDWPQWRGPSGTGASSEPRLPERWSDRENVRWRVPLGGLGVSSPIVWRDRVFVASQTGSGASRLGPRLGQGADAVPGERSLGSAPADRDGDGSVHFVIEAFNRTNGRRLWTHRVAAEGDLPPVHDKHNLASASPTTDGERVYAVFGTGQVVALDHAGKQVWMRHLGKEYGAWNIIWGNGSSPVVHRGTLIIVAYHQDPAYLMALDARTGKQIWKQDRPSGVTSYSTPVVVPGPGGDELIVNSSTGVEAFDPATGRELWHFREDNRFPIPVAMHHDGIIYLSRGYRSGPYAAIRPGGRGDISKSHVVWHVPTGAPYIASLVFYQGLLYMAGDVGVVTCVDAKTGERVWRERLGGVYTASPVAGDGKVYLMSETGETIVLKAGRTPEVLSRNTLDARILASPAVSQGWLFIRTDDQLIAIGS
jgi:outer membrane protein assembly factor BamB